MMGLGFTAPLLLAALIGLPILWWLLRATPPAATERTFGGLIFLQRLKEERAIPARTPWPILALRLLAAAALIVGLAGPILDRPSADGPIGSDTLLIVVDDGWPSATGWRARQDAVARLADRPGADDRQAYLLTTVPKPGTALLEGPLTLREAADNVAGLQPSPALPDYDRAVAALREEGLNADTFWVPGTASPDTPGRQRLIRQLDQAGAITVFREPGAAAFAISGLDADGTGLEARLMRVGSSLPAGTVAVRVIARDGRVVTDVPADFAAGQQEASVRIDLPLTLRNDAARLAITGQTSAGATWLIDASTRRVRAGLVTNGDADTLLTSATYLTQALEPLAITYRGQPEELVAGASDVIVLDDVGNLRQQSEDALIAWMVDGGLLIRFAGPNTAAADSADGKTYPAPLRTGGRSFGGALTWEVPQPLAAFAQEGPLSGLVVPDDLLVRRQVLSRQNQDAEVWAYLADGTPLITARRVGEGLVVLFHVTASPTWSDLPLSSAFPAVLRRLISLAGTSALTDPPDGPQQALSLLDGSGGLYQPAERAVSATTNEIRANEAAPGFYGPPDAPLSANTYIGLPSLVPAATGLPARTRIVGNEGGAAKRLGPPLIAIALVLLALDALTTTWWARPHRTVAAATAVLVVCLASIAAPDAAAQPRPPLDEKAIAAAEDTRFAYVETGDGPTDRISRAGLFGLARETIRRSALEPAMPVGIDPAGDDLSVYPLIYWPIVAGVETSDEALFALEDYMAGGGLIIMDTQDGERAVGGNSPQQDRLRQILRRMNTPPLAPLGEGHILTLSFYRLDDLHGRNSAGQVWVEAEGALRETTDGVPSLVIGGRDWASAWAVDDGGVPLRSPGPGGERRREAAYRSGINMAMVALTGSYKADQVHVGELLERIGEDGR